MQVITHYTLHYIVPVFIALYFYRDEWKKTYLILLATMLVDLDHFLADPIFDSDRCSIFFHPLHSFEAIIIYVMLLFIPGKSRIVGIGLVLHMITDFIDCMFMYHSCSSCLKNAPAFPYLESIAKLLAW